MASVNFVDNISLTNTFNQNTGLWEPWVSPVVSVPRNVEKAGYATVILSAGRAPQNIYDLGVYIERSPDGGETWFVQDSTEEGRNGPMLGEAISMRSTARIESLAGQQVRVRVKLGGCTVSASVVFTEVA